jgi:hypothetical protein
MGNLREGLHHPQTRRRRLTDHAGISRPPARQPLHIPWNVLSDGLGINIALAGNLRLWATEPRKVDDLFDDASR